MEFLILILLLLMNGLFAMYEIALVSSSRSRLENMQAKGNKAAKLVPVLSAGSRLPIK